ncbi:uncharacterized protein [Pyrus communis]|uniref:uncharacterized protein n=1 Tax=Pyrus communis TaxID=23211 RepID=UPI0035C1B026
MSLPSLLEREDPMDIYMVETLPEDWKRLIMQYVDNPSGKHDHKTRANRQTEASNKVLIGILEKIIKEKSGMWQLKLNEALWAYQTSFRSATGTTPYVLTYGHNVMLLVELSINSLRVIEQSNLFSAKYSQAMRQELEDLEEAWLDAYNLLVAQKKIAKQAYN